MCSCLFYRCCESDLIFAGGTQPRAGVSRKGGAVNKRLAAVSSDVFMRLMEPNIISAVV